ncbi:MerR family transcriptional regulator [Paraclostridium bifermentans]|uniref:MerR family transcriptional regulator n=1 Tax=Paraclostridium bifermentans TaxID=1490 RepID=UPI0021C45272|nr:MerR family transcriptional regulator [Paraclostridium bifermentans]GKZ03290.1 hypothetical protein ANS014_17240 [Paraclostridium bifermentans]
MKRKYYKTGELSKIYNLGRDSLKYYEKLGLLNPGRDTNSYRMYTIKDICNLNLIKELRSLDFSMQRIKEYLENRNVRTTKKNVTRRDKTYRSKARRADYTQRKLK